MPGMACPTVAPGSTEPHGHRAAAWGTGNIEITGRGEVLFTPWYGKKPRQNYTQKTPSRLYMDAVTPAKDQMLPLSSGHDFAGGAAGSQACWLALGVLDRRLRAASVPPGTARLPKQPARLEGWSILWASREGPGTELPVEVFWKSLQAVV